MFGWFKRPARLEPEAKWLISIQQDIIRVADETGSPAALPAGELSAVAIETNDTGPWGADLWWMLFDADDKLACAFPQGATGEEAVVSYLSSLPGFDHEAMMRAMRSTGNAVFPLWRRPG